MLISHFNRIGVLLLFCGTSLGALSADEKAAALAQVNQTRQLVGLPPVTLNTNLDKAAQAHADYLQTNSSGVSHDETPGLAGFTGVDLGARSTAAGYTYSSINEVISGGVSTGQPAVQGLVQAIYHRFGILAPEVAEVGIGLGQAIGKSPNFVIELGATASNAVTLASGWLGMYPVAEQTEVVRDFLSDTEIPDPILSQNRVGYPVSIHARARDTLLVSSFSLKPVGGAPMSVQLLNSPADHHVPANAAAIVPMTILDYGTQYQADFSGTLNGQPVARSWTFTTAAYSRITLDLPYQRLGTRQVARVQVSGGNGGSQLTSQSYSTSAGVEPALQVIETSAGLFEVSMAVAGNVTLTFSDLDGQTADAKISFADPISQTSSLLLGWNLIGNPLQTSLVMLDHFGRVDTPVTGVTDNVVSVWKWLPVNSQWAFYAPSMTAAALSSYAAGKSYAVLERIEPGEGYWVNAKGAFSFQPKAGVPSATVPQALARGWSLLGVGGEAVTPAAFDKALGVGALSGHSLCYPGECWQVSGGLAAVPSINTLWSWDAKASRWRFYAPSLALQAGVVLKTYAESKGYDPYDLEELVYLHTGEGFWVNK